jgi:hypothetical protein
MAGANTFPPSFPQLILDQSVIYKDDSIYEIAFIKKAYSIIIAEVNIKQVHTYGLQIQLFHIFERILSELDSLSIPLEHGMFATIIVTCPFPQNNLQRVIELTVQDLNCKFYQYHFFYRNNIICYKPIKSVFNTPFGKLTDNHYKY